MALCTITETILNSEGDPVPGVVVQFTTPAPQATGAGELLVASTVTATSDVDGLIEIDLLQGVNVLVTCKRLGLNDDLITIPALSDADLGSLINTGNDESLSLGIPTLAQVLQRGDEADVPAGDMYVDAAHYGIYNLLALEINAVAYPYIWLQGLGTDAIYYAVSGNGGGDGIFEADADGNQGHQFRSDRANNRGKIKTGGNPFLIHQTNSQTAIMQGAAIMAESTGDMADGFGSGLAFRIMDTAQVENTIGGIGAVRDGGDTSGYLSFLTNNAGNYEERLRITKEGNVVAQQITATAISATVGLRDGLKGVGYDVGAGVWGVGGSNDGVGGYFEGGGTNGPGLEGDGHGTGDGVLGYADGTGAGVAGTGTGSAYGGYFAADTTSPIRAALQIAGQDNFPSSPDEGNVFYHSGNKKHYGYNGSGWQAFY